ncbi:metal-dependent hydrolase [bacterium]|nr:metal-dependent hydrolase [bacterium]
MAILFLIDKVEAQYTFVIVALVATFIPDIDTAYSKLGHYKIFRPLQFFVRHRGFIHSFSFLFLIVLAFVLFWPVGALPFFLGYGLHIFLDAFSVEGIRPFYPYHKTSSGKIRTGGKVEVSLFLVLILIDLFLAVRMFVGVI